MKVDLLESYAMSTGEIVENPSNLDILCGRGVGNFHHEGNLRFRVVIASNISRYANADSRRKKSEIIEGVTDSIIQAGGRFLHKAAASKAKVPTPWCVSDIKLAREKVGHALRDACSNRVRCLTEMHKCLKRDSHKTSATISKVWDLGSAGVGQKFLPEKSSNAVQNESSKSLGERTLSSDATFEEVYDLVGLAAMRQSCDEGSPICTTKTVATTSARDDFSKLNPDRFSSRTQQDTSKVTEYCVQLADGLDSKDKDSFPQW